jgi:hypothetical protein
VLASSAPDLLRLPPSRNLRCSVDPHPAIMLCREGRRTTEEMLLIRPRWSSGMLGDVLHNTCGPTISDRRQPLVHPHHGERVLGTVGLEIVQDLMCFLIGVLAHRHSGKTH